MLSVDDFEKEDCEAWDDNNAVDHASEETSSALFSPDIGDHVGEIERSARGAYVPPEMLNTNIPWRNTKDYPEEELNSFIPPTSTERHNYMNQVCVQNIDCLR